MRYLHFRGSFVVPHDSEDDDGESVPKNRGELIGSPRTAAIVSRVTRSLDTYSIFNIECT